MVKIILCLCDTFIGVCSIQVRFSVMPVSFNMLKFTWIIDARWVPLLIRSYQSQRSSEVKLFICRFKKKMVYMYL